MAEGQPPIRVLLADDDSSVLHALEEVMSAAGMDVVATAADADEAIAAAVENRADVAVLDVKMPGGGPRAAREISRRSPSTRVVALSAHDDREAVASMLRAGALGYVVKGAPIAEIVEAITRAARGLGSLSRDAAANVAAELEEQLGDRERRRAEQSSALESVREALRPGAIRCVFQPIVDLETGIAVGFEALSRFELEPRRGPAEWFAAAAEVGLLVELEIAALETATALFPVLPPTAYLSLNASPSTLRSERLFETLVGVPPERIVLEITEHAEVPDYAALGEALASIRGRGARLAVDDAGAGFASLRHVLALSPDIIKLDISITQGLDTDRARRALGAAFASFSREMSMTLVAEGIETLAELEALRALGVRYGQGYYLGRPSPDPRLPFDAAR